jgi:hypothetical protein
METNKFKNSSGDVAYSNLLHLALARHEWLKKLLHHIKSQSSNGANHVVEPELEPV